MRTTHAIKRTSPKGPGQDFIGTCIRCGRTGLRSADALKECDNPSGMTNEEALIKMVHFPMERNNYE